MGGRGASAGIDRYNYFDRMDKYKTIYESQYRGLITRYQASVFYKTRICKNAIQKRR